MQAPTTNPVTQGKHGNYNAVDYAPSPDPIFYAPEGGRISAIFADPTCGNSMQLEGATGRSGFCHAERFYVNLGDTVVRGQPLGKMGYTGYTLPDDVPQGTHLHWVLNRNGVYVYPPSMVNEAFIKQGQGAIEMPDKNHLDALYRAFFGVSPSQQEIDMHVGKVSYDRMVEVLDAHPRRQELLRIIAIGRIADKDKWDQQIYALQDLVKQLQAGQKLTVAEKDALKKQINDLSASLEAAYNN